MRYPALLKRPISLAILGLSLLLAPALITRAQTALSFIRFEAEVGSRTGTATTATDSLASNGSYLGFGSVTPPTAQWELLYEDNFDGTVLNTTVTDLASKKSKWSPYYSPGHAGNGLRRPSAFSVANGNLIITAKSELQSDGTKKTVSGGMSNASSSTYGRFETRVRVEADPTGTMSGLVMTWPNAGNNCLNGELDFYETAHPVGTRKPFYSYLHHPTADLVCSPTPQTQFVHDFDGTQWHKVVMEWTPTTINIKVYSSPTGGPETLISDRTLTEDSTDKIPDVAHHMTIQLDAFKTTPLPDNVIVHEYVDYVRHYKKI